MTTLTNPAAMGGIDYGSILDKVLNTYQAVSVARIEKDTARYNAAGIQQYAALHNPQGLTPLEAYNTGIAMPGAVNRVTAGAGSMGIPPALLWGGLGLGAVFLLLKAVKK